jgi:hypothetical protein
VRLVNATIRDEAPSRPAVPFPTSLTADLDSLDAVAGIQGTLSDTLRLGAIVGAGYSEITTELASLQPVPMRLGPGLPVTMPAGTELGREGDGIRNYLVGLGGAYQWSPATGLYADLAYHALESGRSGGASLGRLAMGVQTRLGAVWIAQAGWSIDTADEQTLSIGFSARPTHRLSLSLAYEYNGTPEIGPEFGTMQILSASAALEF